MPPWSGSLFDWPDPPLSDRFLGRRWRVPVQSRGKGLTSWSGGKIRPVYGHSPASLPVRESLCSRAYVQVSVLDTAVAAPRRTVGPVRIPASHKRAFNDCLLGDDPFQPSGFRLVAQGGVGNGLNTPCAEWKGCLSRERRRRDDTESISTAISTNGVTGLTRPLRRLRPATARPTTVTVRPTSTGNRWRKEWSERPFLQ